MSWLKDIQETMYRDIVLQRKDAPYLKNADRLHVYGNGYYVRLIDVLSTDFPLIQWILGDEKFNTLAREFITAKPSSEYNINSFGQHFSSFLQQHPLCTEYPFLQQLSEYEWHLNQVQGLSRKKPIDFSSLKSVSVEQWTDAKFEFQPNLLLMETDYGFDQLHKEFREKKTFTNDLLAEKPSFFIFYQKENGSYSTSIEKMEYETLSLLMKDASLGDVLDALGNDEMVQSVFSWFQKWNEKELITNVTFESHESE